MKLQILIPQYKETDDIVKPLLDSIALQQGVDLSEVGVIICNDGTDVHLSEDFLDSYPFQIEYYFEPHRGVSATRNACLDHATADYVMFCDADDMFYMMCGLWIIFREIETGFDSITSAFAEELMINGKKEYVPHQMDSTFVHGKIHRRGYLLEQGIRWNDSLTIHEDSYFNILCQSLSENVKFCPTPFYLWKWRDESVCRHDPKYILKTYNNLLDSNTALVNEFIRREKKDKAEQYVAFMILDAYYTMNKPEWIDQENKEYRDQTERRFRDYFRTYRLYWEAVSDQDKMQMSNGIRGRSVNEGMQFEQQTMSDWLKHIESLN